MLINAIIEQDKDGFLAYAPSLRGCITYCKSYEEALASIKEEIALYLEGLEQSELEALAPKSTAIVPIEVPLNG